jgi:hypothetical protein
LWSLNLSTVVAQKLHTGKPPAVESGRIVEYREKTPLYTTFLS